MCMNTMRQDLNEALQLGGDDASAFYHRGNTHLAAGKPEEALVDLERALELTKALWAIEDTRYTAAGKRVRVYS